MSGSNKKQPSFPKVRLERNRESGVVGITFFISSFPKVSYQRSRDSRFVGFTFVIPSSEVRT
ncbi:hypothetical protein VS_1624 [Vibrio atlanticus]|uniref:Uncharacterized protein n=1 Tax=Vibrio atlanticus (strain LGP32) TaxID=575788 RepID=B7VP60_VIBA3|nr:hypothetical protein VS_1624 [Vibrio atlanticus]